MNIEPYPIKTATYNTTGVPVDYQDRMAQEMIFDNLTPKEKGEAFYEAGFECAIDQVLEIIDNVAHTAFAAEDYHHNEGGKCVIQLIREAVEELKGGEKE